MTALEALQQQGIRRTGSKERGFRYVLANGRPASADVRLRLQELKLPPAWTDVYVSPDPKAKLQAVGRDQAGRWQYRYHPAFVERQARAKFDRVVRFAEALPRMRATIHRDLGRRDLSRARVMAGILKILSTCFLRPGSAAYADENGSYGIATLRKRHVKVRGELVEFDFEGKSGKRQQRFLHDREVARLVRELLKVPGHEVFKWIADDGAVIDVRRRDINAYIKELMGSEFSAKDFRTWAGTLVCACALARTGIDPADSPRARQRKATAAVKETASILGNTPAVCRTSYIWPSVLSGFERGRVVKRFFLTVEELALHRTRTLHAAEQALLEFIRTEAKAGVADVTRERAARTRAHRRRGLPAVPKVWLENAAAR